jgi:ubiquitin thioesterase OTU1
MAESSLILRIRSKSGLAKIQTLTNSSTLFDLKREIADTIGIDYSDIKILKGYPPKTIESNDDSNTKLETLSIKNGELLTVDEKGANTNNKTTLKVQDTSTPQQLTKTATENEKISNEIESGDVKVIQSTTKQQLTDTNGVLLRKVVPSNNSCLFTSVFYVMENGKFDLECQSFMR